jgi:hypothetical protein
MKRPTLHLGLVMGHRLRYKFSVNNVRQDLFRYYRLRYGSWVRGSLSMVFVYLTVSARMYVAPTNHWISNKWHDAKPPRASPQQ